MAISHKDLSKYLRHITLSGRLDFDGVEKIAEEFASLLASAGQSVVIDLTATTLICSLGIRILILNAKTVWQRGGRMALVVHDDTMVSKTLVSVGIKALLPIFTSLPEAEAALLN